MVGITLSVSKVRRLLSQQAGEVLSVLYKAIKRKCSLEHCLNKPRGFDFH